MSGVSKTLICNLALARIGTDIQIADFDTEESKEAKVCRLHYDTARDQVLEDFPWNFATRVVALAEVEDVDPPPGWQFVYQYPTDAVTIRRLIDSAGDRLLYAAASTTTDRLFMQYLGSAPRIPFHVTANADLDGRLIITDLEQAYAVYTARVDAPTIYPSTFVKALALFLASELCMPMRVDDNRRNAILREYAAFKDSAAANSLNETGYDPDPLPSSYTARL